MGEGRPPQGPGHRAPGTDPCADPIGLCNGRGPTGRPSPGPAGHPPSDPQGRVVQQDADNVEQAGQQLQGEVEQPDPQACGGGTVVRAPDGPGSQPARRPLHLGLRTGCPASTDGVALLGRPLRGFTLSRLTDVVQRAPGAGVTGGGGGEGSNGQTDGPGPTGTSAPHLASQGAKLLLGCRWKVPAAGGWGHTEGPGSPSG